MLDHNLVHSILHIYYFDQLMNILLMNLMKMKIKKHLDHFENKIYPNAMIFEYNFEKYFI